MTLPKVLSAAFADGDPVEATIGNAFFGRRKGKPLRDKQTHLINELLPQLQVPEKGPIDLAGLFGRSVRDVWVEIGFGGGEHLIKQAMTHRDLSFIGVEPFVNGMAKLLGCVADEKIDNIRLHNADAIPLLARLPQASVGCVFILYPDPWPKRRQRKRRIISDESLSLLARVLRPGGRLCFATDIDDYAAWTLARLERSADFCWEAERADDWMVPWEGWLSTRYEQKAFREGRKPTYITAIRK